MSACMPAASRRSLFERPESLQDLRGRSPLARKRQKKEPHRHTACEATQSTHTTVATHCFRLSLRVRDDGGDPFHLDSQCEVEPTRDFDRCRCLSTCCSGCSHRRSFSGSESSLDLASSMLARGMHLATRCGAVCATSDGVDVCDECWIGKPL